MQVTSNIGRRKCNYCRQRTVKTPAGFTCKHCRWVGTHTCLLPSFWCVGWCVRGGGGIITISEGAYALPERLKPLLDLQVSITGEASFKGHGNRSPMVPTHTVSYIIVMTVGVKEWYVCMPTIHPLYHHNCRRRSVGHQRHAVLCDCSACLPGFSRTCLPVLPGGVHFDLVKRVLRDISRSGQGPEEIIQQVRPKANLSSHVGLCDVPLMQHCSACTPYGHSAKFTVAY